MHVSSFLNMVFRLQTGLRVLDDLKNAPGGLYEKSYPCTVERGLYVSPFLVSL